MCPSRVTGQPGALSGAVGTYLSGPALGRSSGGAGGWAPGLGQSGSPGSPSQTLGGEARGRHVLPAPVSALTELVCVREAR